METCLKLVENKLDQLTSFDNTLAQKKVFEAMRYSLLGGGKRIRAILTMKFCEAFGGDIDVSLIPACAIEMIHAYSLIHDDLPCMDDDILRRGKPTCHIVYGEAIAVLAGDALLNKAFEVICDESFVLDIGQQKAIKLIRLLSNASGNSGMISGQTLDIENENTHLSLDELTYLHSLKTGALIRAAVGMGGILAGCDNMTLEKIDQYAQKIGLGFQIIDDILDVTGDVKELGKSIGSDVENNKNTYVTLLGIEIAQQMSNNLFKEACEIISSFNFKDNFLLEFTKMLSKRVK